MHVIRQDLRAYATSTPLESWQSVYSPVVQGAAVQFLNQYRFYQEPIYSSSYSNAEKRVFARDLLTMVLLHDIDMSDYFMAEVHQVMDQLRIWEAEFEPYWRQKEITTDNDSIKLSYYHWKDRSDILVVVGNLKNTPQAARITFAESMPAATQAVDALSGESFDLSSQPVPLGDYSCRILKCKKP